MKPQISNRLQTVRASATIQMSQLARDLAKQGHDVISLSMGEPDFDTPDHISKAAIKAIQAGKTRYTAVDGIPELKEAICEKFKRENHLNYSVDQINVSPGGKAVLFNALLASMNSGDEVIIPTPCWVSYPDMTRLCGGEPRLVHCSMENGFKLTPNQLDGAISEKTKWLILNSPSNPTGVCYSKIELAALGEVLKNHPHVMILTDDIYEHLVYDDQDFSTIAEALPELTDRVLTMNGASKAFAMTGWRLGYAAGPKWLIDGMRKVMSQTTSNASSISQWAAHAALTGPIDFLKDRKNKFQQRRDLVVDGLSGIRGLECPIPSGAFYVFPRCETLIGQKSPAGILMKDDQAFASCLLEERHVAVVPGTPFHGKGHFRLSFATDMKLLEVAFGRIQNFCENCS